MVNCIDCDAYVDGGCRYTEVRDNTPVYPGTLALVSPTSAGQRLMILDPDRFGCTMGTIPAAPELPAPSVEGVSGE